MMMTTSEMIPLAVRFAAGAVLGLFFFGGLAWTVRRLSTAPHPALLVIASFLVRMIVTVSGLLMLGGRKWQYYLAALAGFLVAKLTAIALNWGKSPEMVTDSGNAT